MHPETMPQRDFSVEELCTCLQVCLVDVVLLSARFHTVYPTCGQDAERIRTPVLQVASKLQDSLSTTIANSLATQVLKSKDVVKVAEMKILSMDLSAQTAFFQQCMQAPSVNNRIEVLVKDWPERVQQVLSYHLQTVTCLTCTFISECVNVCTAFAAFPLALCSAQESVLHTVRLEIRSNEAVVWYSYGARNLTGLLAIT